MHAIARLNMGGAAAHVVVLGAGIRARYPALLATGATSAYERDITDLAREHDLDVVRIPGLAREIRLFADMRALWALWRLFRRTRPDIVHTHTAKAGTLGRLAAWLAGVPVRVHTFHGHVFTGFFSRWRSALYVLIERLLARLTSRIVALSASQATELTRYLGVRAAKVSVIPLGFDLRHFLTADRAAARARFRTAVGVNGAGTVITIVARLAAVKNQALAIQAFAALGPVDAVLVLVGGGEEEPRLRALAHSLGIADRVRFAGWWHDLEAVYYGADVVALSSNGEGTPVCLIEALACGRAAVACDVGGVADVLEEGRLGILVPPGQVDALAAAFRRLLDPAERARFENLDPAGIVARYDITRLVADVQALYDDLVRARSGDATEEGERNDEHDPLGPLGAQWVQ